MHRDHAGAEKARGEKEKITLEDALKNKWDKDIAAIKDRQDADLRAWFKKQGGKAGVALLSLPSRAGGRSELAKAFANTSNQCYRFPAAGTRSDKLFSSFGATIPASFSRGSLQ